MEEIETPVEETEKTQKQLEEEALLEQGFEKLPTGKFHVSFSEISSWYSCTWKHKLQQIDKIELGEPSISPDFGTACHSSCEDFLNTRIMKPEIAHAFIEECFEANKENIDTYLRKEGADYDERLKYYKDTATEILNEVPKFLDDNFKDWECIEAEHKLYEQIEHHPHLFKGYIDAIIKTKDRRDRDIYWVLDWKTTNWGWDDRKRSDDMKRSQIGYYKRFFAKKMGIDPRKIMSGFVLLKLQAKPGKHIELVQVTQGPTSEQRSLTVINDMFASVKRGMFIKNKYSCTFCEFKGTEHCPGTLI